MRSSARQYLAEHRDEVFELFGFKCVRCGRPTRVIHEIIPISHGKASLATSNRIPLCDFPTPNSCHEWAHAVGTNISIPILQELRTNYLTRSQHGALQAKDNEQEIATHN